MRRKTKWNWLFAALAAMIVFSLFGVSGIAVSVLESRKGQVVTVEQNTP
jgi:hypothetical protein